MLIASAAERFRDHPEGTYVAGESWIFFSLDAAMFGWLLWGSAAREDVSGLVQLMEAEFHRGPHAVLADVSAAESMDASAFEMLLDFVQRRSVDLAKIVTHVAFVVPAAGYNAALAQGFFAATPAPFPLSLARDVEEGLRQLGRSEAAEEARARNRPVSQL